MFPCKKLLLVLFSLSFLSINGCSTAEKPSAKADFPIITLKDVESLTRADTDLLRRRLRLLAGSDATDCGNIQFGQDPTAASQCAEKAFSAKQPFIVQYWMQGIDSIVGVGLAGTKSGQAYAVEYDSMGWSSDGIRKPARLVDGHHNVVEPCPAPVRLRETASKRLTCFPPDPKAKGNIMSPYTGPY